MNELLMWLAAIEFGFMIGYFIVPLFFKGEDVLIHKIITSTIVLIAYVTEIIVNIMTNQSFGMEFFIAFLWGITVLGKLLTLKVVRFVKKSSEDENKNQLK